MVGLRPLEPSDSDQLHRWRNLPEVARYMYTDHYITAEEHHRWFDKVLKDSSCRYWIIVCDGNDVGVANVVDIDEWNSRCYWAFYVASKDVRGKGIGSFVEYSILRFVFEELRLNKLCGQVLAFNENVLKMHESFGFKREGLLREHVKKGEEFCDVVEIGMLRSEWVRLAPTIERRLRQRGLLPSGSMSEGDE